MIEDSKRDVPKYNGMVDGVRKIVAEDGIGGLYRGLGPVVSLSSSSPPLTALVPRSPCSSLSLFSRKG